MSDSTGPEGPRNLYMFERWCPLVLTIEGGTMQYSAVIPMSASYIVNVNGNVEVHATAKIGCPFAAKEGVHMLAVLPTMADTHVIHTSCMQLLQFSPASQAGLTLEAILPRRANQ